MDKNSKAAGNGALTVYELGALLDLSPASSVDLSAEDRAWLEDPPHGEEVA
jgi:hypothetical protein